MAAGLDLVFRKARNAEKKGDAEAARLLLQGVLDAYPNNLAAKAAIARLTAGPAPTLDDLAAAHRRGDHHEAIRLGEALAPRHPDMRAVPMLLGAARLAIGDAAGAEDAYRRAIALDPATPDHHVNLAAALRRQDRAAEAAAALEAALRLDPAHVNALFQLGTLHRDARRVGAAIAVLMRLLEHAPDHADALFELGGALAAAGHIDPAIDSYRLATRAAPHHAAAHCELGNLLATRGRPAEAAAAFARTAALVPDNHGVRAQLLLQQAFVADWSGRDRFAALPIVVDPSGGAVRPFSALPFEDDPARQLARSRAFAAGELASRHAPFVARPRDGGDRIRIGYFSADFYDHATLRLMAGLLRTHDRDRFEIRAYDFSPAATGEQRQAIAGQVDALVDLREATDRDAIERARADGLDVAVDLKGYTRGCRPELFAARLAPVQIAYLGYPGSMGAPFIDYLVADPLVVPPGDDRFYDEALIRLPHSYQPNDDRRARPGDAGTRADHGLPAQGFVFASFNHVYKVGPREWDVWMRLLAQVEGSVLWLLDGGPEAAANLAREAAARGVDPARLVHAAKRPQAEHVARQVHADLFLDTFAVNAHTTASDALWVGLPVLTRAGRQFAARVAASVVTAAGLPELVTDSDAAYEALALDLARDPARLAALRARLATPQATALFDTAGYTRALEAGFTAAHARAVAGLAPAPIDIG